jgi:hypothetical protein
VERFPSFYTDLNRNETGVVSIHAMSVLQATNAEIRRRAEHEERRRQERRSARLPVRRIDALIADLEELHLAGRKRVPETFDRRLEALAATLPASCAAELRSRITIVHLMDRLYAIQGCLLRRPPAPGRDNSDDGDQQLPRAS